MTILVSAARAAGVAAFLLLSWSLPVAAQTVLETSETCSTGACEPTAQFPNEDTVLRCIVIASVPQTAFLVKCVDLLLGTVSVDPRVNGYSGSLVCTRMMEVSCPGVVQTSVRDYPEPISTKEKLDCTVIGSIFTDSLKLECARPG